MFSGIVETTGKIITLQSLPDIMHLCIQPANPLSDLKIGDSVCINGVCLTVTELTANTCFSVSAVPETLKKTTLGELKQNDTINLERAMQYHSRIGGHLVQGHVDCVATITTIKTLGESIECRLQCPSSYTSLLINKGFITIDGMSITIIDCDATGFSVTLIPHTRAHTIACTYKVGTHINLEIDNLTKTIKKMTDDYFKQQKAQHTTNEVPAHD